MVAVSSSSRLAFVRLKNVEQFCQAGLVPIAGRAISVLLNPFGMLLAQGVVNLVLKLNVRANFASAVRQACSFSCPMI